MFSGLSLFELVGFGLAVSTGGRDKGRADSLRSCGLLVEDPFLSYAFLAAFERFFFLRAAAFAGGPSRTFFGESKLSLGRSDFEATF